MSKHALGIYYESSTIFRIGEFVAKFWTVQIFRSEFLIGLRIARTDYGLYVKISANWVHFSHESKYLSIRGDSWDLGPVWNRGIKQYFLHILSLETDKNPSWISGRWQISVFMTNLQEIMDFWLGRNGTHKPLMNSWASLQLSYGTQ